MFTTDEETTLRDHIAVKALEALLTQEDDFEDQKLRRDDYQAYTDMYAESAYAFADAMLRARTI